jgi:hypothetical protein
MTYEKSYSGHAALTAPIKSSKIGTQNMAVKAKKKTVVPGKKPVALRDVRGARASD